MGGKLKEPMVITDYRREPVCILPVGFYFDDERREMIWARFDEKGEALSRDDLLALFPYEEVLREVRLKPPCRLSTKVRRQAPYRGAINHPSFQCA